MCRNFVTVTTRFRRVVRSPQSRSSTVSLTCGSRAACDTGRGRSGGSLRYADANMMYGSVQTVSNTTVEVGSGPEHVVGVSDTVSRFTYAVGIGLGRLECGLFQDNGVPKAEVSVAASLDNQPIDRLSPTPRP